jgi:RNase adaptor protein for sRNA GlmZ degradation
MQKQNSLHISIKSFGYHRSGVPKEDDAHGGGYIFDCRGLPNPGRSIEYQFLTGQDDRVIRYLESFPQVEQFYQHTRALVKQHADAFAERGFEKMSVAYGCTGGQHRSVYFGERLASDLKTLGYHVSLDHVDKP